MNVPRRDACQFELVCLSRRSLAQLALGIVECGYGTASMLPLYGSMQLQALCQHPWLENSTEAVQATKHW